MFKVFRWTIVAIAATVAFQFPATTAALAKENWVYVGTADCFRSYVDLSSLKRNGNFVWFWWRTSFITSSEQKSCPTFDDRKFQFVDWYMSIDCQSGSGRFRKVRVYDKNQKLVPEYSGDARGGGTLVSLDRNFPVMRYICRR